MESTGSVGPNQLLQVLSRLEQWQLSKQQDGWMDLMDVNKGSRFEIRVLVKPVEFPRPRAFEPTSFALVSSGGDRYPHPKGPTN